MQPGLQTALYPIEVNGGLWYNYGITNKLSCMVHMCDIVSIVLARGS